LQNDSTNQDVKYKIEIKMMV